VLIVTAAASTAALTGLAVRQATDTRQQTTDDLAQARLAARSGIEATLEVIAERPGWRSSYDSGDVFDYALPQGAASVTLTDETDGDLNDDDLDPYTLTSVATAGDTTVTLQTTVAMAMPTYRERILAQSPIRYWPLDETSGYPADDLTETDNGQHSNPGQLNGMTGYDGGPAPAYTSNFSISFGYHRDDLLLDEGTIMCHFYLDSVSGDHVILSKEDNSGDSDRPGQFRLWVDDDSGKPELKIRFENNKDTVRETVAAVDTDTWYHATITFGSKEGLNVYLDGVREERDSSFKTGRGTSAGDPGNNELLIIGARWGSHFATDSLNGSVRDVIVFDRALSASEVEDLVLPDGDSAESTIAPDAWAWITN
jgi:hypothetical protein